MREIRLKDGQEPIELNAELLMKAYRDLEANLDKGAYKSAITMGIVELNGEEMKLEIKLYPKNCICKYGSKVKNYDECNICGGKWSTRKKEAR